MYKQGMEGASERACLKVSALRMAYRAALRWDKSRAAAYLI